MRAVKEEDKWQARDDARTLARAEEIYADKERLKRARAGAREILDETNTRLDGLAKVAGRKVHIVSPNPAMSSIRDDSVAPAIPANFSSEKYNGRFRRYI